MSEDHQENSDNSATWSGFIGAAQLAGNEFLDLAGRPFGVGRSDLVPDSDKGPAELYGDLGEKIVLNAAEDFVPFVTKHLTKTLGLKDKYPKAYVNAEEISEILEAIGYRDRIENGLKSLVLGVATTATAAAGLPFLLPLAAGAYSFYGLLRGIDQFTQTYIYRRVNSSIDGKLDTDFKDTLTYLSEVGDREALHNTIRYALSEGQEEQGLKAPVGSDEAIMLAALKRAISEDSARLDWSAEEDSKQLAKLLKAVEFPSADLEKLASTGTRRRKDAFGNLARALKSTNPTVAAESQVKETRPIAGSPDGLPQQTSAPQVQHPSQPNRSGKHDVASHVSKGAKAEADAIDQFVAALKEINDEFLESNKDPKNSFSHEFSGAIQTAVQDIAGNFDDALNKWESSLDATISNLNAYKSSLEQAFT